MEWPDRSTWSRPEVYIEKKQPRYRCVEFSDAFPYECQVAMDPNVLGHDRGVPKAKCEQYTLIAYTNPCLAIVYTPGCTGSSYLAL